MQSLVNYTWPGNVRELRNLVESMVVLATGREITLTDIPPGIREGGASRLLPVPMGPIHREEGRAAEGRELEFIVRSLVEMKLQLEELRRRVDEDRGVLAQVAGGMVPGMPLVGGYPSAPGLTPGPMAGGPGWGLGAAPIEQAGLAAGANAVTITLGMTMAEIEKAAIVAALRETRGNRRKAAEILDIGERTLYRKLKVYQVPDRFGE